MTGENVGGSVPDEFVKAWAEACAAKSRTAKSALFSKWLQSGGDWGKHLVARKILSFFPATCFCKLMQVPCDLWY